MLEYRYKFEKLNLGYFEIPKNSSTTFRHNVWMYYSSVDEKYNTPEMEELFLSGYHENDFSEKKVLESKYVMILYRNPVARIKSAYANIYLNNEDAYRCLPETKIHLPFKSFLETVLLDIIYNDDEYNECNIWGNHFKPQAWFVPREIFEHPRAQIFDSNDMKEVRKFLHDISQEQFDIVEEKKYNDTYYERILHMYDINDVQIMKWWQHHFPGDVNFYKKCVHINKQRYK